MKEGEGGFFAAGVIRTLKMLKSTMVFNKEGDTIHCYTNLMESSDASLPENTHLKAERDASLFHLILSLSHIIR